MLTKKDLKQIKKHGLTLDQVIKQLDTFRNGIPFANIVTAATVDNGILALDRKGTKQLIEYYDTHKKDKDIIKFVPASGAATRMFKFLFDFIENFDPEEERVATYIKNGGFSELKLFLDNTKNFPFINDIRHIIREKYPDYKNNRKGVRAKLFAKTMLEEEGLNYKNLPKGLIPFHKYKKYYTTAFEEQLYEAAFYATANSDAYLHFTFSEAHLDLFKKVFESVKSRVTKKTKTNFHISYSFQKKETDTLAVNLDNKPYYKSDSSLLFRPSGHGALLNNLNELDTDIIFIKNIDNVVCEALVEDMAEYKKVLAGKLLWLQKRIFQYSAWCENEEIGKEQLSEIRSFLWNKLNIKDVPEERFQIQYLLNRPLRVCGMVRNTGAPGGGPFWVKDAYGNTTIQIVEMSQIDKANNQQSRIAREATHFNPVDIVCGVRDRHGKKYDLHKFADPDTGFISSKSDKGNSIKALELPGLWNGAMAKWNSAFVEVPLSTFNPVKTVNDLLRPEHCPNA